MADYKRLSKFLALMLRHKPDGFGLTLDTEGFADVNAVWSQIQRKYGSQYSLKDFYLMLESPDGKQRYEVVEGADTGHSKIRALYGHSVVEVAYERATPPDLLYHGTTQTALDAIRTQGLTAQKRQFVHLSTGTERATQVAGRHSHDIILLKIRALDAHNAGLEFYHPEPQHYLAKSIPPEYIEFPPTE